MLTVLNKNKHFRWIWVSTLFSVVECTTGVMLYVGPTPSLRGWIRRYTQTIMPGSLRPLGLLLYVPSIYCRYIKKTGVNATTIYFLDCSYNAYWEPFIWQGMVLSCPSFKCYPQLICILVHYSRPLKLMGNIWSGAKQYIMVLNWFANTGWLRVHIK